VTATPNLAALDPLERLVLVRARSLVRYAKRSGARSLEGHFEISAPRTRRLVPVLLLVHDPGEVTARWFPEASGPPHQGRYPVDWLAELDFAEGDAFLPRVDLDAEDDREQGRGQNGRAPGTSRSPGAQHQASGSGGDRCQQES
jgi:hypothetical protein